MQSDHLLFAIEHPGWLLSSLRYSSAEMLTLDVAQSTEKERGCLAPFYSLWSLDRLSTSSPSIIERCRCFKTLHWVAHVQAFLVQQDAIILTIDFLVKFKRSFRAPERRRLGEAMVTILDFLSPPKLHIFSQIFTNLFDIRLTLTNVNVVKSWNVKRIC